MIWFPESAAQCAVRHVQGDAVHLHGVGVVRTLRRVAGARPQQARRAGFLLLESVRHTLECKEMYVKQS